MISDDERQRRIEARIAAEQGQPESWWWLSFADYHGFRGVCIVRAPGPGTAIRNSHRIGINPGGEVCMSELDWPDVPEEFRDRLLDRDGAMAANAWATSGGKPA